MRRPARLSSIAPVARPHTARSTATHRGRERDQGGGLVALAEHFEHTVAARFAERSHVGSGCLEDPEPEQSEHGDESEVVRVGRVPSGAQHGLELQMAQPEGWRLRWNGWTSDVLGG